MKTLRVLIAGALLAGCVPAAPLAPAPPPTPAPETELPPMLAPPGHTWVLVAKNTMGFALCDPVVGKVAYVRTDFIGGPEQPQLVDHENEHILFFGTFPDCEAFWIWFAEDRMSRRLEVEARAYCASVKADMRSGRYTYDQALFVYANKLADQAFGTTTVMAIRAIQRFCPSPS